MLKVELLTHTPGAEKIIASAAKLCYSSVGVDEIQEGLTEEKVDKFVNMLINIGHESPVEHVSFTFAIEGISRACSHQIVRHRHASYSQQSQRYVNLEDTFEYIIPKNIEENRFLKNTFICSMNEIYDSYVLLTDGLIAKYEGEGMETSEAEKKAIEDARYVLPNACETKMVLTMNARELLHFFKVRCCRRAQAEIRELANKMLDECKEVAPIIFKGAGPECNRNGCKEGKMSCDKPWK